MAAYYHGHMRRAVILALISFRQVAVTQGAAMLVTSPRNDPRRFVVEQDGRIRILDETGALQAANDAFLEISEPAGGPVVCCGAQGL
jgi:hypothetical protein